jgi:hypothetical protein
MAGLSVGVGGARFEFDINGPKMASSPWHYACGAMVGGTATPATRNAGPAAPTSGVRHR